MEEWKFRMLFLYTVITLVHSGHVFQAPKRTMHCLVLSFRWGKISGEHREDDRWSTSGLREWSGCNSGWEKGVLHWLQQQVAAQRLHAPDHGSHSRWTVTGTWKIQWHIWFSVHFTGFRTLQFLIGWNIAHSVWITDCFHSEWCFSRVTDVNLVFQCAWIWYREQGSYRDDGEPEVS